MKYHAVLFASLIALPSVFSTCYGHEDPGAPGAANTAPEMQKPGDAAATNTSPEMQKPAATAGSASKLPALQKPGEAEAIAAAIAFLNPDGEKAIQKSEFLAWGTYSEQYRYWPMKLRLTYKRKGSDKPRQNDYAVKISEDSNGKLIAATYYAWRTDFK